MNQPVSEPSIEKGTIFEYNSFGKITTINYSGNNTPDITNTYDLEGRITKSVRGKVTLEYTYGKKGELLSEILTIMETDENNKKTFHKFKATYLYNETGGRTTFKTPNGRTVTFKLNAFNQTTSILIAGLTYVSEMEYHENGDIKTVKIHNIRKTKNKETITLSSRLNSRKLLEQYTLTNDVGDIFSFSTTYDKSRRVKSVANNKTGDTHVGDRSFSYDNTGQVISASGDGKNITFKYDLFGNMLKRIDGLETYENTYNISTGKIDQLTYKKYDKLNNIINSREDTIVHNNKGQIIKFGNFSLKFDDARNIFEVKEEISNVQKTFQKNYYDGFDNRVLSKTEYLVEGVNNREARKRRSIDFFSILGNRIHRSVYEPNFKRNNQTTDELPGDIDYVEVSNTLTLQIGECTVWLIQHRHNNNLFVLNGDNTLKLRNSVGPFGKRFSDKIGRDTCVNNSSSLLGPLLPIKLLGLILHSSTKNQTVVPQSKTNNNKSTHVFYNSLRDVFVDIYFMSNQIFYSANIGRTFSPTFSSIGYDKPIYVKSPYVLRKNDLVNYNKSLTDILDKQK